LSTVWPTAEYITTYQLNQLWSNCI